MDAVIVIDEDHRVLMFNAAAERLFGYSRQEALGASIAQFLPHRLRDSFATRIDVFSRQGQPHARTDRDEPLVGLRRSGEEFPVDAAISQFVEEGRRIYTLIVRDVTERVRTHDELLRSNLDLQQFAFVASHDLRTPLRSIMGYVQLLERRYGPGLDPKALDLIHRASSAVQTLDHLTDDLLSYARVDAQVKPFTTIDCNEVLADTLQLMDAAISESAASISAGPLPVVLGDRRPAGPAVPEPAGQQHHVPRGKPAADPGHLGTGRGRRVDHFRGRQRHRHRGQASRANLRNLQAPSYDTGIPGHRHRTGLVPAHRRTSWRPHLGYFRSPARKHLLFHHAHDFGSPS